MPASYVDDKGISIRASNLEETAEKTLAKAINVEYDRSFFNKDKLNLSPIIERRRKFSPNKIAAKGATTNEAVTNSREKRPE